MPAGYAVARRSIPASCRWWFCVAGACCAAAGASAAEFRELLADAGVNAAQFASLDDLPLEPTAPQRQIIDAILFRLDQLERGQLPGIADIAPWQSLPPESAAVTPGSLVHLSGIALHVEQISAAEDEALPLLRCTVRLETGAEPVQVVCRRAPRRWPRGEPIEEPVELTGVMTGATAAGAQPQAVVLAHRLQWRPVAGVPSGVAWLAAQGFDAGLLDDVRPISALATWSELREADAFYGVLAALARGNVDALRELAAAEVRAAVDRWRERAAEAHARLGAAEATDAAGAAVRREQQIAAAVAERARRGVSSVMPLYFDPADAAGRLVLLEGTARRAVRVVVDAATAPADLPEYYELELFTADSQNLPIVCCVPSLPQDFPTGDAIHAPVRVAGVLLIKWSYPRRRGASESSAAPPARLAAPLILAGEPQWLRPAAAGSRGALQWAVGAGFAAALAVVWWLAARAHRADRLARSRRTVYDAGLAPVSDRRDFPQ